MAETFDQVMQFGCDATRVVVGTQLLNNIGTIVSFSEDRIRAMVVTDENLRERYAEDVRRSLEAVGVVADLAAVEPGDAGKSLQSAESLYERLEAFRVGRDGLVVGVGGGVVTDLAGFVAGTWLRGVASVLCPTTLEADIDAAIGGKTAVNLPGGKNMVGVFHHPKVVIVDTACLHSLSRRDLVAGMAESIKHAVITSQEFTAWHEDNAEAVLGRGEDVLGSLIERNLSIKADFVSRDVREQSQIRAMLNFGHTVGHAIESLSAYRHRHGECVSIGMVVACRLSESMGLLDRSLIDRIVSLLHQYGLPTRSAERLDEDEVLRLIQRDKKVAGGAVCFVLLEGLGRPVLRSDVPESAVRDAVRSIQPTSD